MPSDAAAAPLVLQPALKYRGATQKSLRAAYLPREVPDYWSTTALDAAQILDHIASALPSQVKSTRYARHTGAEMILHWLSQFPGNTWQQRWRSSPADSAPAEWFESLRSWLATRDPRSATPTILKTGALALVGCDVIRPGLPWLLTRRSKHLRSTIGTFRDPEGFEALADIAGTDMWHTRLGMQSRNQIAIMTVAKGGTIREITVGDCLELKEVETQIYSKGGSGRSLFYTWLRELGNFPSDAPSTLRSLANRVGQVSVEALIDRYQLRCRPIRDLLVDYVSERQPALDYNSLEGLARALAIHFWGDLERHHPGIDSLHLSPEVASAWKTRIRSKTIRQRQPDGTIIDVTLPRMNAFATLTTVKAFYLDLAFWAAEEPGRWGPWVAPCPIKESEIAYKKHENRRKARADQRTRERLPVLPTLVRAADERLKQAQARLQALRTTASGSTFTVCGETYTKARSRTQTPTAGVAFNSRGRRVALDLDENRAFWAWASIEFLRLTGARIEEMLEVSHHSLIQYRLPSTGEIIPLLQIAPSKTDEERLMLVSPELADVLSAIICRVREASNVIPCIPCWDEGERLWNPPMPLLFQWHRSGQNRHVPATAIRKTLNETLEASGLTDSSGKPLRYQPHDFRRIFITDAILNGLPPHIAQVIAGHKQLSTTMGYKATYPNEAIEAHRAFIARRRALRPSEEYRRPTEKEWEAFLGHFERRKLSVGTCGRAYGTECIHEHACLSELAV
ncbi:tyrosine-type recombinase/integrase [Streptomyces sp. NPDC057302]|uniref:tyrosine-type recombinase/integrase n=1 Tax=Streptomyces sp. NPDC057302 TaxID=3346094 RepID=UPI0036279DD0